MGVKVGILPGAFMSETMDLFDSIGYTPVRTIDETLRAIVFLGGTDINPLLYLEPPLKETQRADRSRDQFEQRVFKAFVGKIPLIGICRGAQLLNVFNGGKLYQHVDGHARGPHPAHDVRNDNALVVSSLHHQMMRPAANATLLLTASRSTVRVSNENHKTDSYKLMEVVDDVEAVYYPHTKCFCIQSHPEIGTEAEQEFFFDFLDEVGI